MNQKIKVMKKDRVDIFHEQVNTIMNILGYPDAFVTDSSQVSDFLDTEIWNFVRVSGDFVNGKFITVPDDKKIEVSEHEKIMITDRNNKKLFALSTLLEAQVYRYSKISELAEAFYFKTKSKLKTVH